MKAKEGTFDIRSLWGTVQNVIEKITGECFLRGLFLFLRRAIEIEDLPEHSKKQIQPSYSTYTLLKCLSRLSNKQEKKC